jgi:hypothetical protein
VIGAMRTLPDSLRLWGVSVRSPKASSATQVADDVRPVPLVNENHGYNPAAVPSSVSRNLPPPIALRGVVAARARRRGRRLPVYHSPGGQGHT